MSEVNATKPQTKEYPVYPHLTVPNCDKALEWYKNTLGAEILKKMPSKDEKDKILHSEFKLPNGGLIMCCDDFPQMSKKTHLLNKDQLSNVQIHLHFKDNEKVLQFWDKVKNSNECNVTMAFDEQFWGERYGAFHDPFGIIWSVGAKSLKANNKKRNINESKETDKDNKNNKTTNEPPNKKQRTE